MNLHGSLAPFGRHLRQPRCRDVPMHEQCIKRVADRRTPHLRVVDDAESHFRIGGAIHVGVTHACPGFDHRNRRVLYRGLDQSLAASRDDDVDVLAQLQHALHERAIGRRNQLHAMFRQTCLPQAFLNGTGNGPIARQRFAAAAKHDGVPGLDADGGDIARHVRPRFVDDPDHAERNAAL